MITTRNLAVAGATALAASLALSPMLAFADSSAPDATKVERGKYLVSTSACHDCHTPWKMGEKAPSRISRARCQGIPRTR